MTAGTIFATLVLVYARALIGIAYGSGSAVLQRGPKSFDCVGYIRYVLLHIAPTLWPTAWGGDDSWGVPNLFSQYRQRGFAIEGPTALPRSGDLLFFGTATRLTHVGMAVNATRYISALGSVGVAIDLITGHLTPLRYVVRMGMTQEDTMLKGSFNGRVASLKVKADLPHKSIPQDGISPWPNLVAGQAYSFAVGYLLDAPIPGGQPGEDRKTAWLVNPGQIVLDKDVDATPLGALFPVHFTITGSMDSTGRITLGG